MNYSYQLRGTNGSGKTFVATYLIAASEAKPVLYTEDGRKVRAYRGMLNGVPIFFLGSYETRCGGCDTIPSVAEVAGLLAMYMAEPGPHIVFFEGLMISHMLGTVGAMQAELGKDRNVLAFLDTPLEKCIERVITRRMLRKDDRPFDPKNVIKDHPRVAQSMVNAVAQGYRVRTIDHTNACNEVREDIEKLYRGEL